MSILVKANEAIASRRRVFFDLRDATDGITPENGEAGGQPQIALSSANGQDGSATAGWTDTGIDTLKSLDGTAGDGTATHGRYYATLTQAVCIQGVVVQARYKSANTLETPGDSVQVVGFDPYGDPGVFPRII